MISWESYGEESMLQFAVGFVITPSCRKGRSKTETPKPKMGCRPSKKQNNAKKQGPRAASPKMLRRGTRNKKRISQIQASSDGNTHKSKQSRQEIQAQLHPSSQQAHKLCQQGLNGC